MTLTLKPPTGSSGPVSQDNTIYLKLRADNATYNTSALAAAVLSLSSAGGGVAVLPTGTFGLTGLSSSVSNVTIQGAGRGATTLQLVANTNSHLFDISGNGWTIEHLTVDGNRSNQTAGHCIRIAGDDHYLHHLHVKNAKEYGIGMSQSAGSSVRRMHIDSVYVLNTGLDGIESKDKADGNTGNRISNVVVENHGLDGTTSAAIDCRGPWQLSNVTVEGITGSNTGVRFRQSDGINGFGSDGSSLSNFRIIGTSSSSSIGVSIPSDNVTVENGYVEALNIGVSGSGDNFSVDNVVAKNCNIGGTTGVGFDVDAGGDFVTLRGCIADGCRDGFTTDADNTLIEGGAARNSVRYGINPASSTNLRIRNVRYANNGAADVNYSSTASAATVTLPTFTDHIPISGTTTITAITASWKDRVVMLRTTGAAAVTDGGNLKLAGSLPAAANQTLTLVSDGTNWWETARSAT